MRVFFAVFVLAIVSGCAVHTPEGSIIIDPDLKHGRGDFCPPGQAKKGNC